ncbi:MAG: hypothetical protein V1744_05615 [Candidatus Altiarchaeota archaeon]
MRFQVLVLVVVLLAGCVTPRSGGLNFKYGSVYVRYGGWGGPVPAEQYLTEYVVNNTVASYRTAYSNGSTSFYREGTVDWEKSRKLGEDVVAAGVYGMLEEYNPSSSMNPEDKPTAVFFVSIDGRNKSVLMKPYVEEYAPGSIVKIISRMRGDMQWLRP